MHTGRLFSYSNHGDLLTVNLSHIVKGSFLSCLNGWNWKYVITLSRYTNNNRAKKKTNEQFDIKMKQNIFLNYLNLLHISIRQTAISKHIKSHFFNIKHSLRNSAIFTITPWWSWVAYNRTTWVSCRFHLAEWPSCHISKDIGAGLAKWYGWVMGCRPHPDTMGRWGAAAKPQSLLTSPSCALSKFADDTPWATLPGNDTCQPFLFFCNSVRRLHAMNTRLECKKWPPGVRIGRQHL